LACTESYTEVCRRVHILFRLFVFVCVKWCPTHIVLCFLFCFSCFCLRLASCVWWCPTHIVLWTCWYSLSHFLQINFRETEGAIKNGQSRETGNTGNTIHKKTDKIKTQYVYMVIYLCKVCVGILRILFRGYLKLCARFLSIEKCGDHTKDSRAN
jgi:hypothetical protein